MTILHLRLIDRSQIVSRLYDEDEAKFILEYPMLIDHKNVNGTQAMNLVKYMPFNMNQIIEIDKSKVIAAAEATERFIKYYYNSIHYQALYVEPQTEENIDRINESLEAVLAADNQQFINAVRKYQDRIPDLLSDSQH